MLANASSINIPPSIPFTDESKLNPPKSMPSTVKAKKKGRFLLTSAKGPSEQTTSGTQSNQDLKSLQRQHQVLISPAQSIEDPDSGANHQIAQSSSLSALNCKDNFTSSSISSLTQPLHPPPNPAQAISVFYNLPDTMNTNGDSGKNGHLGMGKLFQLCDQMKNEMIETDKTLLNLQNELSLLRAKNAELEIKNLEMNKIYLEEKRLKEYAEANFEQLKKLVEKDHINLIQHHERNKEPVPTFTGTSQKETREHIKKKFQTFDLSTNPNHVQNSANNHSQHGHSHIQTAATIKNDYQDLEKMQKHNEQSNPTYMNATLHPLVQKLYFSNASSTSVHTLTPTPIPTPPKVSSALKHQYSSSSNTTLSGAISCNGVIETLSQHPSSTQIESKRQEQGQVQIHSSTIQESKKFHVKEIKCDKNSKSTQSNQRNSNGILFSRNEAKTKIRQFKTRNPSPASIQS